MKVGDLVRCLFQPSSSKVENGRAIPMKHMIKGELGIYVKHWSNRAGIILFPQYGYEHPLAWSALEVVSEG